MRTSEYEEAVVLGDNPLLTRLGVLPGMGRRHPMEWVGETLLGRSRFISRHIISGPRERAFIPFSGNSIEEAGRGKHTHGSHLYRIFSVPQTSSSHLTAVAPAKSHLHFTRRRHSHRARAGATKSAIQPGAPVYIHSLRAECLNTRSGFGEKQRCVVPVRIQLSRSSKFPLRDGLS